MSRRHLDKEYLQRLADSEWKHAEGGAATAGPAVSQHFKALMDNASTLRPIPLDWTLVGQARSSLPRTLMPRILYDDIKASNVDEPGQGLRIDQLAGLGEREGLQPKERRAIIDADAAAVHERDQFKLITIKGRAEMVQLLQKDAWIWGDSVASLAGRWGALFRRDRPVRDGLHAQVGRVPGRPAVRVASTTMVGRPTRRCEILTSPTSPLRGLLTCRCATNTTLVETATAAAPKGVVDQTKKKGHRTRSAVC